MSQLTLVSNLYDGSLRILQELGIQEFVRAVKSIFRFVKILDGEHLVHEHLPPLAGATASSACAPCPAGSFSNTTGGHIAEEENGYHWHVFIT